MPAEVLGVDEVINYLSQLSTEFHAQILEAVLEEGDNTREFVRLVMPIDTGWAQASYGYPEYGGIYDLADDDDGVSLEIGRDLSEAPQVNPFNGKVVSYEYIEKLNEGSSVQAPAGFIDAAAEAADIRLAGNLENRLDDVIGS